jgi:putrescine aminotransferase
MMQISDKLAGKTREEIQALDRRHHLHSFTAPDSLRQAPPFIVEKADGCYIEGQGIRLLDMMAGLGCVNVGYGRKELAQTAEKAMSTLSYYHSFSAVSNAPAAALSGRIAELAPEGMNKVYFANSGSEANETAMKIIAGYWRKKGKKNKRKIITRDYAYHGSTIATSALNGNMEMIAPYGISSEDIIRAPAPFWYREGGDLTPEEYGKKAARDIETLILEHGASKVAAMFVEPVQATMGAIVPPSGYLAEVERICRKYDVLLVADEVVTGLGRTGNWFAQETYGFNADIMTLAKGLSSGYQPISAVVLQDDIADVFEEGEGIFQHGFTTSAHPVTAAVALRNLDILEEENLVSRIKDDVGPYLRKQLSRLDDIPIVGEVRTEGLFVGIELTMNKETREQFPLDFAICTHVTQACLMKGLLVRPCGNCVVLCPPFIVSHAEIDFTADILEQALNEVYVAISEG